MMRTLTVLCVVGLLAVPVCPASADFAVAFTKLTGLTGGNPAQTAVYRADLSSIPLSSIQSITIQDASFGLGGAAGQFSGFDLDAIRLSNTQYSTAGGAAGGAGLNVFDFSPAGTLFTPGAQRSPTDPKLFGTNATGTQIFNQVAKLGLFDANSTTAIPGAAGFVSLGDGGRVSFNLTSAVSTQGLYLYIGEVGDNGEVAAGSITVSDTPVSAVPEPATAILAGLGSLVMLAGAAARRRTEKKRTSLAQSAEPS